jgi:hypothetical protein
MIAIQRLTFILLGCLILAGCATLQIGLEQKPTPDQDAIGTLAALMLQGTQYSAEATRLALPVTPTALTGAVSGQICYPSERIPPMTLYFISSSNAVTELNVVANQVRYQVDLPPGEYSSVAWVKEYQLGGLYSEAVVCGLTASCTDHDPVTFQVTAGQSIGNIDICDWAYTEASLPTPPGFTLP